MDQAAPALAACTVAVVSAQMPRKLPKSTSDDSHLAGDSEQSENKDFAGMAAEVSEAESDEVEKSFHERVEKDPYGFVASVLELDRRDVKAAIDGVFRLAATELKKSGSFKLAGMLNLKLKVRPATKARKGVNRFTKEPYVFKAKRASKTLRAIPTKKLRELVK